MDARLKSITIPFNQVTLDLGRSPHKVSVGNAVMLSNIDFDDQRGVLVGRYGTSTVNKTDTNPYLVYDLFRVIDADTGNKYILATFYESGVGYRLAAMRTNNTPQTVGTVLKTVAGNGYNAGDPFILTARPTFMCTREPKLGDIIVIGTNGIQDPFYWTPSESGGNITVNSITSFPFGGAGVDFHPKFILDQPWKGRAWFALRAGEETTWWWSDSDNFLNNVAIGNAGFRAVPQDQPNNPVRAGLIMQDRLVSFGLDSINEIRYTGDQSSPFEEHELIREQGAIHPRAVVEWNGKAIFLDKRAPYLKVFNGSQIETLGPDGSIEKGFEKWVDATDLLNVRMSMRGSNLLVSFKAAPAYADVGTDGQRWLAVINLAQPGRSGGPYFPFNLWNIRTNDILVADEGTDFGQTYVSDANFQLSTVTFTGSGLNDLTTSGGATTTTKTYRVQIDGTGSPNTFKWSDDNGATWKATGLAITGVVQQLGTTGTYITFGATTGHTSGNRWDFTAIGYVRRILDWYDVRNGGIDAGTPPVAASFGDKRGLASDPVDVTYQFRTGWIDFDQVVNLKHFRMDGDFEGTPSGGAVLQVRYRFDNWQSFITQSFGQVRTNKYYPVDPRAYGRKCQLEFLYTDKQSRPILYSVGLQVVPREGIMR